MREWEIPVTWEMYGTVIVEAETLQEAMKIAEEDETIELPDDDHYIDGSWRLSSDDIDYIRFGFNNGVSDGVIK